MQKKEVRMKTTTEELTPRLSSSLANVPWMSILQSPILINTHHPTLAAISSLKPLFWGWGD